MKTHPPLQPPPEPGPSPEPIDLAHFILWKFLQMPAGGLYAKWNPQIAKGVWFYSRDRDYMFREPACDKIIYEELNRSRFRSLIFRFGSLSDDGLCGHFEFQNPGSVPRRYTVHASFYPETGIGLWIAITSRDDTEAA